MFLALGSQWTRLLYPAKKTDDIAIVSNQAKNVDIIAPQASGSYRLTIIWSSVDLLSPHDLEYSESDESTLQSFLEDLPEFKDWGAYVESIQVHSAPDRESVAPIHGQIFAVRVVDLERAYDYWAPLVFRELLRGHARFSWSYSDQGDLHQLLRRSHDLDVDEQDCWQHGKFLLDVQPGDFFVYVNVPTKSECVLVEIKEQYSYDEIWDPEKRNDLRHVFPCRYIGTFHRDSPAVAPELAKRLKLKGSHWKLNDWKPEIGRLLSHFR